MTPIDNNNNNLVFGVRAPADSHQRTHLGQRARPAGAGRKRLRRARRPGMLNCAAPDYHLDLFVSLEAGARKRRPYSTATRAHTRPARQQVRSRSSLSPIWALARGWPREGALEGVGAKRDGRTGGGQTNKEGRTNMADDPRRLLALGPEWRAPKRRPSPRWPAQSRERKSITQVRCPPLITLRRAATSNGRTGPLKWPASHLSDRMSAN